MGQTIYEMFRDAGLKMDDHESDLYVEATPTARAILREHFPRENKQVTSFRDNVSGKTWLDVPLAYDPFWKAKGVDLQWSKPSMPPGTKRG